MFQNGVKTFGSFVRSDRTSGTYSGNDLIIRSMYRDGNTAYTAAAGAQIYADLPDALTLIGITSFNLVM